MSPRTTRWLVKHLGYSIIEGEKRHFHAESTAIVAYRATYLQRKWPTVTVTRATVLSGRVYTWTSRTLTWTMFQEKHGLRKIEIVSLQEAKDLCELHRTIAHTRIRLLRCLLIICIVGAGVVYQHGTTLRRHFVKNSYIWWNAQDKKKTRSTTMETSTRNCSISSFKTVWDPCELRFVCHTHGRRILPSAQRRHSTDLFLAKSRDSRMVYWQWYVRYDDCATHFLMA